MGRLNGSGAKMHRDFASASGPIFVSAPTLAPTFAPTTAPNYSTDTIPMIDTKVRQNQGRHKQCQVKIHVNVK